MPSSKTFLPLNRIEKLSIGMYSINQVGMHRPEEGVTA